jgi:hypothetical protein
MRVISRLQRWKTGNRMTRLKIPERRGFSTVHFGEGLLHLSFIGFLEEEQSKN